MITVCDNAAGESCPIWKGSPVTVHWGIPDPAVDGDFDSAYRRLRQRVEAMLALPFDEFSAAQLSSALNVFMNQGAGPPDKNSASSTAGSTVSTIIMSTMSPTVTSMRYGPASGAFSLNSVA